MAIDLNSDLEVLAATISGEAESEPLSGKQAVALSVLNRVKAAKIHPHFGDGTVRGACLAPSQYSCWLPGPDRDRIVALDLSKPYPALKDCIIVAKSALAGALNDFTEGATYYFAQSIPAPSWVVGAMFCGLFGTQLFWRNVK